MRIAIATDAWHPQVNGVVRTLAATVDEVRRRGHQVELITPDRFTTVAMPGYPSIRLAMAPRFGVRRTLDAFAPDIVHLPTEGPLGWSARGWCKAREVPFTTAFHTRFPDYVAVRTGIGAEHVWPILRRFHERSAAVLVATDSLARELAEHGIANTRRWSRGIDPTRFWPDGDIHPAFAGLPRPILLNVGRVAAEKNLPAFLSAEVPGTKVVVGDGPALHQLRAAYPQALYLGELAGDELASAYRGADCFVFPSRTDTFGLVIIEALACGLPVAAYPVAGPLDILGGNGRGIDDRFPATIAALDSDLEQAITRALPLDRHAAAIFGRRYTWTAAADLFLATLSEAVGVERRGAAPSAVAGPAEFEIA